MPYTKDVDREKFRPVLNEWESLLQYTGGITAGDLNYLLSTIVGGWVEDAGGNYAAMNAAVGMLECCKLEYYRRVAAPYEDQKCAENGDVY